MSVVTTMRRLQRSLDALATKEGVRARERNGTYRMILPHAYTRCYVIAVGQAQGINLLTCVSLFFFHDQEQYVLVCLRPA